VDRLEQPKDLRGADASRRASSDDGRSSGAESAKGVTPIPAQQAANPHAKNGRRPKASRSTDADKRHNSASNVGAADFGDVSRPAPLAKTPEEVEAYRIQREYDLREKSLHLREKILGSTPMLVRALALIVAPGLVTAFALQDHSTAWTASVSGGVAASALFSHFVFQKVKNGLTRRRISRLSASQGAQDSPGNDSGKAAAHDADGKDDSGTDH
jgi:hypothetical protein